MKDKFENAKLTAALLLSLGEEPKRLNSKAKVKFANANGAGHVFKFGDKVLIIESFNSVLVVTA